MNAQRLTNARIQEWLTADLDSVSKSMHTTRVQLNSAALWWFCRRLTPEQRAEILGEFVKVQALGGREPAASSADHRTPLPNLTARRMRRRIPPPPA